MPCYVYYENVDDATITVNPAAAASYPITNLNDPNKNTKYMPGSAAATTIIFDFGAGKRICNSIVLVNNNGNSDAFSIKLSTEDTDDNGWDDVITYHVGSAGAYHASVAADEPHWEETFEGTEVNKRYWRLEMDSIATTNYIGTALLGIFVADIDDWHYDNPRTRVDTFGISTLTTPGGYVHSHKRIELQKRFPLTWSRVSSGWRDTVVDTFWESVNGGHLPFLFKDTDGSLYWVRADNRGHLVNTEDEHKRWGFSLNLKEEL